MSPKVLQKTNLFFKSGLLYPTSFFFRFSFFDKSPQTIAAFSMALDVQVVLQEQRQRERTMRERGWTATPQQPGLCADIGHLPGRVHATLNHELVSLATATGDDRGPTKDDNHVRGMILGEAAAQVGCCGTAGV